MERLWLLVADSKTEWSGWHMILVRKGLEAVVEGLESLEA